MADRMRDRTRYRDSERPRYSEYSDAEYDDELSNRYDAVEGEDYDDEPVSERQRREARGFGERGRYGYGTQVHGPGYRPREAEDYTSGWREGRPQPGRIPEPWEVPGPHTGRGPKGYTRSSENIREEVCERLTQHGRIDATEVEVKVAGAEVTLSGMVNSREAKRLAEDVAESVSGVTDVHNQLRVKPGEGQPWG